MDGFCFFTRLKAVYPAETRRGTGCLAGGRMIEIFEQASKQRLSVCVLLPVTVGCSYRHPDIIEMEVQANEKYQKICFFPYHRRKGG